MSNFREFIETTFLVKPNDLSIFELAITHPSCNSENNTKHHDYERLEFVGDSVIGFASADLIFKAHPEMDQGLMSKLRSYLVCSKSLANYSRKLGVFDYVKIGHSISRDQLYKSDKILEDIFDNYHFEEEIKDGDVTFQYKLLAGKATTRNAIKLLSILGYPDEIIESATDMAQSYLNTNEWKVL